jgi:hypothetical protein
MPERIAEPTAVAAAGTLPKTIEEYVGRVNKGDGEVSIARMRSPRGWQEPAQTPGFDEYTLVLAGLLVVEHESGRLEIGRARPCTRVRGSGCATARRSRAGRRTSPSACRRSRRRPSTVNADGRDGPIRPGPGRTLAM